MSSGTAADNARQLRKTYERSIDTSCVKLFLGFIRNYDPTDHMNKEAVSQYGTNSIHASFPLSTTNSEGNDISCGLWAAKNKKWIEPAIKERLSQFGIKNEDVRVSNPCYEVTFKC